MAEGTCSVTGCERPVWSRGWCGTHYQQRRRAEGPAFLLPHVRNSCRINHCDRPAHSDGLCTTHRRRQDIGARLDAPIQPRGLDLHQAVRRGVVILNDDECWPAKRTQAEGYGSLWALGREWLAHRAAWTAFRGPLPDDLQLHHQCRNRACANPAHLQPVTQAEHTALHAH